MKRTGTSILCALIVSVFLAPAGALANPEYSVQSVPSGNSVYGFFEPRAINSTGSVSGKGSLLNQPGFRALAYVAGAGFFSPPIGAFRRSTDAVIGDNGDIAFIYEGSRIQGFGGDQSVARWSLATSQVTNYGRVLPNALSAQLTNARGGYLVGFAYFPDYTTQGFCIGCGPNGTTISTGGFQPSDITSVGIMAGMGMGPNGYSAALYYNNQMELLNSQLPQDCPNSSGVAINDSGEVAVAGACLGSSAANYNRAFVVARWHTFNLGTLGDDRSSSHPTDLNNRRVVVGYTYPEGSPASQYTAFVWDEVRRMRDLNTLVPPNSINGRLTIAHSINEVGQILAYAVPSTGSVGTYYILTPQTAATPAATAIPTSTVTATPAATLTATPTATRTPTRTPSPKASPIWTVRPSRANLVGSVQAR